jgi:hypothetical protein
MRRSSV